MGRLDGKAVLVVDGATGLGRAAAVALAREGARVAVGEREGGAVADVVRAIEDQGGMAVAVALDPTDDASCARAVDEIVGRFGGLDALCNRAPEPPARKLLHETSVAEWDATFAESVTAQALPTRAALRAMRGRGGSLILMTSGAALVGVPNLAAYSGCTGSLVNTTRVLAVDGAGDGIRANCVCLGTLEELVGPAPSEDHAAARAPISRAADRPIPPPEELAPLLVFLASDESRHVTGQIIAADDGLTAWR